MHRQTTHRHVATGTIVGPAARPRPSHAVYYICSPFMQLLYIGQTSNLMKRLRRHALDRDWFTPDCHIFIEWFHQDDDAQRREAHAIWNARPAHNRRIDEPTGHAPTPDVPLQPLRDLMEGHAGLCSNCEAAPVQTSGLCPACYAYQRRTGTDRPAALHAK